MRTERHMFLPGHGDVRDLRRARMEPAAFEIHAVGGNERLRHHAEDASAVADGHGVVDLAVDAQRHAHREQHIQIRRAFHKTAKFAFRAFQQDAVVQQVVGDVRREHDLGERDDLRAEFGRSLQPLVAELGVVRGVGDGARRRNRGHRHKPVVGQSE